MRPIFKNKVLKCTVLFLLCESSEDSRTCINLAYEKEISQIRKDSINDLGATG